ncbi:hypothetical protein GCM10009716_28080 [Streptomyces sodiiphilus]|uniref:Uncharacterized protein n=1 Tax=Streptomyces sodiiphilus TaxID=226217 RepID=A0ABN2PCW3_9ACTN
MTGIRPAGTSRETIRTSVPCRASRSRALASWSGSACSRIRVSHREPLRERAPRRPSQYSSASPVNAAREATAKTSSEDTTGLSWCSATTAAELTTAPVGTMGISAPSTTSRNSDG